MLLARLPRSTPRTPTRHCALHIIVKDPVATHHLQIRPAPIVNLEPRLFISCSNGFVGVL
jgi:hypothetical protein